MYIFEQITRKRDHVHIFHTRFFIIINHQSNCHDELLAIGYK